MLQATLLVPGVSGAMRHEIRLGPTLRSRPLVEEVVSSSEIDAFEKTPYFAGSYRSQPVLKGIGAGTRGDRKLSEKDYDSFQSILSQVRDIDHYPELTKLAKLYTRFRVYSEWSSGRESVLRESAPTGRTDTQLSEKMDDLPAALNALEETPAHESIRKLLSELKESYRDYVTRIIFGRVGLELVETPFKLPVPASRLSDGTLRFLALAAILFQPEPSPLVCLEEPELGMHPDMIRMVAKMIIEASKRTQLVITTHSEHLLTALQDDFDALFAFGNGLSGSEVRRLSREEYKDWRNEHTLGELWTSGELGGNRW